MDVRLEKGSAASGNKHSIDPVGVDNLHVSISVNENEISNAGVRGKPAPIAAQFGVLPRLRWLLISFSLDGMLTLRLSTPIRSY